MIDFLPTSLRPQVVGRLGELIVELELLARGWSVGNFNANVTNAVGWDLFACKGARSVKLRVKTAGVQISSFRWTARADGSVFLSHAPEDPDDFVAAVKLRVDGWTAYVIPTSEVANDLRRNHANWLAEPRIRGEGSRKDTSMRNIHLGGSVDRPGQGYASRWSRHEGAWHLLESVGSTAQQ